VLDKALDAGTIVAIQPIENLFPSQAGDTDWMQGFGKGHVKLSVKWGATSSEVDTFFDAIAAVTDDPPEILFTKAVTRLSPWGVNRIPEYTPTVGQAMALHGSLGDTEPPSGTNPFVVAMDQGGGDVVDLDSMSGISPNADIESTGRAGGLVHRIVVLVVDSAGTNHDYDNDILPRLQVLLGRDPDWFDFWFDGTVLKFFIPGTGWVTT
jgi:hypothetical protein